MEWSDKVFGWKRDEIGDCCGDSGPCIDVCWRSSSVIYGNFCCLVGLWLGCGGLVFF